ncbi:MAG: TetR family transcriptional regulator [Mycobacteriaceae bacterium]
MTESKSRTAKKEQTRQALLDGTLELANDRSFASLSLREVTRNAGIVPTAFYRHFTSMEDLGVTLVEDSMRLLRQLLREVRRNPLKTPPNNFAEDSLVLLIAQVRAHPENFQFLVKEKSGGVAEIRRAISVELRLFASELTTDLARMPGLLDWEIADLGMAADLIVGVMMNTVANILDIDPRNSREETELVDHIRKQMRLITLGMRHWHPPEKK